MNFTAIAEQGGKLQNCNASGFLKIVRRILPRSDLRERLRVNGGPCGTYQCVSVEMDGSAYEDVESARFQPLDAAGPTVGANCRRIEDNTP